MQDLDRSDVERDGNIAEMLASMTPKQLADYHEAMEPLTRLDCDKCGREQKILDTKTIGGPDPFALYYLACGHTVL